MNVGYAIAIVAVGVLIALFRLSPPNLPSLSNSSRAETSETTVRMVPSGASTGRDRVPAGWYMAPRDAPSAQHGGATPGDSPISTRTIRAWAAGAVVFTALCAVAWATGHAIAGLLVSAFVLFAVAVVVHDLRRNRWLRRAAAWNTGHHHDFPAPA
jgi:hypothetical protein